MPFDHGQLQLLTSKEPGDWDGAPATESETVPPPWEAKS